MGSRNLRPAPRWITPDMVRRILTLAMPVDGGPVPVTTVATRGVKPKLAIVGPDDHDDYPSEVNDLAARSEEREVARCPAASPLRHNLAAPVWAPEEDERLREAYIRGERIDHVAEELGRTEKAAYSRAEKIGLSHPRDVKGGFITRPKWSEEEDALLKQLYGNIPTAELPAKIGRSRPAIFTRANALGLDPGYRQWTRQEMKALRIAFHRGIAIADVASALGRKAFSVSKYASRNVGDFGRRPILAEPITLEGILALEDDLLPLSEFRKGHAGASSNFDGHREAQKAASAEQLEADRPLFQIAFDRGVAVADLSRALGRNQVTVLLHTKQAGFRFGRRPVLADPLTINQLLALADPAIPLPELHCDRAKRERLERSARNRRDKRAADVASRKAERAAATDERMRQREAERALRLAATPAPRKKLSREVEKVVARQAVVPAPSREPAPLPPARAHPLPARPVTRASGMLAYAERMRAALELLRARHFVVRRYNPEEVIGRWQVTGQHGLLSNEELVELAVQHGLELRA